MSSILTPLSSGNFNKHKMEHLFYACFFIITC
ncbi:MAG: hypothetical protein ACI892_001621, partial [Marinobacter maritimus]